ncbi:TonB-dependent siderophore receptor [Flavobacterium sp.]|uniref:TonB-dependent siderophore receptor n=1 Tax=Flavobacterium sp. TaxID=239 RepID=UPI0028BF4E03|nr:TonB-dependent siderophore receptor [Flavobacterium sp.]
MKKIIIPISVLLLSTQMSAQEEKQQTKNDSIKKIEEIIINGNTNKFKREKSTTVSKMPLKDIENPQVYNTVSSELIREQVVTNFNDALKNATGVTRLWESTGRGTDGAEFYSMRGFAVQPTMINGLPGINNGKIDPINVDNIEVIKGPSGTLFGSSLISYGGLINIVTKKPYHTFGGEIGYAAGTYGLDRVTADFNTPLTKDNNVLLRVTTAFQKEGSFQDTGFNKSFFIAPSLSYTVNDRLSFLINTEFTQNEAANAPMIFLSRYAPLSFDSMDLFDKNYKKSFNSNELSISNPTFNLQAQMFYKLSESWTSQTVLSRSNSKTDGYYSYLWDSANGDEFTRFISKANGETYATDIQQNFIGDFKIGNMRNRVVAGLDYYKSTIMSASPGWVGFGTVSLVNGTDKWLNPDGDLVDTPLTKASVDNVLAGSYSLLAEAETEVYSAYVSDVFNILPELSAMASLRVDRFEGRTNTYSTENKGQTAFSPKFGIVYQPIKDKLSVFGNYMNGFMNVAPTDVYAMDGTPLGTRTFDPEHANQFEFGVKTNLYQDRISASVSYYHIKVKNKLMTDIENPLNSVQGGEVESKGIEVSIIANPMDGLNIVAGFSNNDSEVTKDHPDGGYLGMRPEEAGPETLVNLWASYTLQNGKLKGLGFGLGGNYASEFKILNRSNIGTFELPNYAILNSSVSYNTGKFNLSLKLNNMFNEKYYSGWSTVTPQRLRNVAAGLTYKF